MKHAFLLFTFASIFSLASRAQTTASFGVKAGLSSSGVRGEAADNLQNLLDFTNGMITTKSRTGFFAGVNADIPLGGAISVEPGLYYTQKGYTMSGELGIKGVEFLGANADATLQSDYLDIPIVLKANVGSGLQVFAGPQFSYLSSAKLKTTAGVLGINLLNKTFDATDQFNRWDVGVTGGVGYQFTNGINLSASYDYGLARMDANKSLNAYNNGFKIGLGFKF